MYTFGKQRVGLTRRRAWTPIHIVPTCTSTVVVVVLWILISKSQNCNSYGRKSKRRDGPSTVTDILYYTVASNARYKSYHIIIIYNTHVLLYNIIILSRYNLVWCSALGDTKLQLKILCTYTQYCPYTLQWPHAS